MREGEIEVREEERKREEERGRGRTKKIARQPDRALNESHIKLSLSARLISSGVWSFVCRSCVYIVHFKDIGANVQIFTNLHKDVI